MVMLKCNSKVKTEFDSACVKANEKLFLLGDLCVCLLLLLLRSVHVNILQKKICSCK